MQTVKTASALQAALLKLQTQVDTSFGLTFLGEHIGEEDIRALRENGRICDAMLAASATKRTAAETKLLASLGVDVLYTPEVDSWLCEVTCHVKQSTTAPNPTFMLHSILQTLPQVVTVPQSQFSTLRILKNLQQTFGQVVFIQEVA